MGAPSIPSPAPVPTPPPAAAPATLANPAVSQAGIMAKNKGAAAAGAGADGTVATSPQGLTATPKTAGATLLGGTS